MLPGTEAIDSYNSENVWNTYRMNNMQPELTNAIHLDFCVAVVFFETDVYAYIYKDKSVKFVNKTGKTQFNIQKRTLQDFDLESIDKLIEQETKQRDPIYYVLNYGGVII